MRRSAFLRSLRGRLSWPTLAAPPNPCPPQVLNERTQAVCKVKFKEQGFLERVTHAVSGHLEIPGSGVVEELSGAWDSHISVDARPGKPPRTLWRRGPVLPGSALAARYHWNEFTVTLNDVPAGAEGALPPTDSRLRPDQKMLEEGRRAAPRGEVALSFPCARRALVCVSGGEGSRGMTGCGGLSRRLRRRFSESNSEKLRLEEKQRAARRNAESGAASRPPFSID